MFNEVGDGDGDDGDDAALRTSSFHFRESRLDIFSRCSKPTSRKTRKEGKVKYEREKSKKYRFDA